MLYYKNARINDYICIEDELADKDTLKVNGYVKISQSEFLNSKEEERLKLAKKAKMEEIFETYVEMMHLVLGTTPISEQISWESQEREANAYKQTQKEQDAPLLNKIAKTRGIDLAELVNKVIAKSAQYKEVSGNLLGTRQRYEQQIQSAKSIEELEAIKWDTESIS